MKEELMMVKRVEYHELEKHIRHVYGFEDPKGLFSVVAMEEWNNDSDHLFRMERKPLDKWERRDLDEWRARPLGFFRYRLHTILQDMVNNGYLEEGNHLIAVCW